MIIEPEIAGASVVLVGSFNPAIFSPDWFVRQNLLEKDQIVQPGPNFIIHPQIAQFSVEWCQISVDLDKFSLTTTRDPLVRISDLASRTFGQYLTHTPLRAVGLNRYVHFRVSSLEKRDEIGYKLAPPEAWGEWGAAIKKKSGLKHGGMQAVAMQQNVFDYDRTGNITATVQPSSEIKEGFGVFVQVNDHYEITKIETIDGISEAITILDKFEESRKNSEWIIEQVMRLAHGSNPSIASRKR
ncbi:MAG: hypothetical protein ACLP1W_08140 [Rhodomicrobium sp.]